VAPVRVGHGGVRPAASATSTALKEPSTGPRTPSYVPVRRFVRVLGSEARSFSVLSIRRNDLVPRPSPRSSPPILH
jgi:hypothetical protein